MRRIPFVLALLLGCTGIHAADELEIEDPEPAPHGTFAVPHAVADAHATSDDPCAGATGHVAALCTAEGFDEGCVGLSCGRTESRTAVECLLEEGFPDDEFVALTRARNPVTRAYARSALLRRGALDDALIEEASADDAMVTTRGGCFVDRVRANEVAKAARIPPRDADAPFDPEVDPIVDRWTHAYGCTSTLERRARELEARERERMRARERELLELEAELRAQQ